MKYNVNEKIGQKNEEQDIDNHNKIGQINKSNTIAMDNNLYSDEFMKLNKDEIDEDHHIKIEMENLK